MAQQMSMEETIARNYELMMKAWEPAHAAARATAEPQAMYVDLVQRCPVRDLGGGSYALSSMADILYVNRHPDVEQGSKYLGSDKPAIPLGLDGEEHRKYRRLLDPVFSLKQVAPLAGQIRDLANEMIDGFIDRGEVDAYAEWCEPLPSMVFLSIMGLPVEDLKSFLHFKNLTLGNDPEAEAASADVKVARRAEAVAWIHNYFNADLDARAKEASPRDDMISGLLQAEVDGHRLSREEMLAILGLLMIAGLDTVAASLSCFLSYFARHPDDRARVIARPDLLRSAIEELMRFESPVTEGFRITNTDLDLPSGAHVPAGSWMHISWSSANVDPAAFPNPLEVDLERAVNPHIGFASGQHRCLGSHLARLEMQVALSAWHDRIPNYAVKPGEPLVYSGNPRAPHRFWLTWS